MPEIAIQPMTAKEARKSADQINEAIEGARLQILEFYERDGWKALGYRSWRKCVTKEFGKSQSYLYRQLDAAKVEREISPIGEIGKLPEGPLRELKVLPEGKRAEAWQAAVDAAPDGKPTAKQVERAVDNVRREIAKTNGVHIEIDRVDEPTTTEEIAEEHEQAKAQSEDEMSDEDWLATLPLSKKLTVDYCLKIFRKDAVAWRALSKPRANYLYHAQRTVKRGDRGEFASRVMSFLSMDGPEKWRLCAKNDTGGCDGTGTTGKNKLQCPGCKGRGYSIR